MVVVLISLREPLTCGSLMFDVFLSCEEVGAFGVVLDNLMGYPFPMVSSSSYFNNNNNNMCYVRTHQ